MCEWATNHTCILYAVPVRRHTLLQVCKRFLRGGNKSVLLARQYSTPTTLRGVVFSAFSGLLKYYRDYSVSFRFEFLICLNLRFLTVCGYSRLLCDEWSEKMRTKRILHLPFLVDPEMTILLLSYWGIGSSLLGIVWELKIWVGVYVKGRVCKILPAKCFGECFVCGTCVFFLFLNVQEIWLKRKVCTSWSFEVLNWAPLL